jgi:hypothetical protein
MNPEKKGSRSVGCVATIYQGDAAGEGDSNHYAALQLMKINLSFSGNFNKPMNSAAGEKSARTL